ncbi:helix-turn-helix domain-containing protein [Rhizobium leguminosarum]|jgi:excisionase family DNA binding protein|uniref:helix-turn-helix domain-containing protein n=1 Tax=Rhizobium leguminosarum TaxID=384 RepID=UPI001C9014FA|nr:helix-turn-helix domain-containing protein [Rhizobium leguminosarum]
MTDEERRPFTPKRLAERWLCSERHVRNMLTRGDLPFFRLGGKLIRIKMDDVEEFERNGAERVSNVKEV